MGTEEVHAKESGASGRTRELSTVTFPYSDLGTALSVAGTIKEKAGISCETEQLAAWMGQSARGGSFRSRYSAARLFGLISTERGGRVALTSLGQDILNPAKSDRAKATAFLNIELFEKIYEDHKGHALPPNPALERMVVNLGVTPKQADRARQAFVKSARVANFIDRQSGVFIAPGFPSDNEPDPPSEPSSEDNREPEQRGGFGGHGGGELPPNIDPIIVGLIRRLPSSGDIWPLGERKLWLDLLAGSFNLVYKDDETQDETEKNARR